MGRERKCQLVGSFAEFETQIVRGTNRVGDPKQEYDMSKRNLDTEWLF